MDLVKNLENVSLRLKFVYLDQEGQEKYRTKSFSKIKKQAEDENILRTGQLLANMQKQNLARIEKLELSTLEEG